VFLIFELTYEIGILPSLNFDTFWFSNFKNKWI